MLLFISMEAKSQDISDLNISADEDVFERELRIALTSMQAVSLPRLDCAIEYIRRLDGEDIVYRRGPIDLHQKRSVPPIREESMRGSYPASGTEGTQTFSGGLLLELPRAGETGEDLAFSPMTYKYMLRVAVLPASYEGSTLVAKVLLERAVVSRDENSLRVLNSEVFSRNVELEGNLPLKFDLPAWDASTPDGIPLVPISLQEAVLITLETPRHFALPPNIPEPFAGTTQLSYALPEKSLVRLSIRIHDGERVLDEGERNAGTYDVTFNADDLPDDSYTAVFSVRDTRGNELFRDERVVTKNKYAQPPPPELPRSITDRSVTMHRERFPYTVGVESGVSYQFPTDKAKAMRNMFTHVAVRAGYKALPWLEIGIVAGQDSFHETPDDNVDIERISDFGGVVAWTYGYAGPYLRITTARDNLVPFIQFSAVWSDTATASEFAAGLRTALFRHVDVYLGPSILAHFRDEISTKVGIHYGMTVRF